MIVIDESFVFQSGGIDELASYFHLLFVSLGLWNDVLNVDIASRTSSGAHETVLLKTNLLLRRLELAWRSKLLRHGTL